MMKTSLAGAAAALALAASASTIIGANEETPRSGLDIRGIESVPEPPLPAGKGDKKPTGPVEITAHEATYDKNTNVAFFTDDVVVKHPEFGLSSDRLTVTIKSSFMKNLDQPDPKAKPPEANPKAPADKTKPAPGGGTGAIEKAVAEGHVIVTQTKLDTNGAEQLYTGKAERLVYESKSDTVKLYGWPKITQSAGGVVTQQIVAREQGCVITLDRAGKIDVKGYHTITLQDAAEAGRNQR